MLTGKLSGWAVWSVVVASARAIGIEHHGANDMRRTCARLCQKEGGELEQIQFLLGHAELETTARYLGSPQEIAMVGPTHLNCYMSGDG